MNSIKLKFNYFNKLRLLYWNTFYLISNIYHNKDYILFIDSYSKIIETAVHGNKKAAEQLSLINKILEKINFKKDFKKIYKIKFQTSGDFFLASSSKSLSEFDTNEAKKIIKRKFKYSNFEKFEYKYEILDTFYHTNNFNQKEIGLIIYEDYLSLKLYFD